MDKSEFLNWALAHNVDSELASQISEHAPEKEEYNNLFSLGSISGLFQSNDLEIPPPNESGFWLIGSCINGDLIVVDVSDKVGSVKYLNHETLYSDTYKLVKVADCLNDFMMLVDTEKEPIDFYDAITQARSK